MHVTFLPLCEVLRSAKKKGGGLDPQDPPTLDPPIHIISDPSAYFNKPFLHLQVDFPLKVPFNS